MSGSESGLLIAEPRPFALQLELEAANEYRIQDSSPESASERGGSEEIFCNQDLHPESSPSSRGEFEVVERPFEFQFDQFASNTRAYRRRQTEFEKRKRMSIFACAVNPTASIFTTRKSLFVRPSLAYEFDHRTSILNKNLVSEHRFEGCVQLSVRKEVPAVDSFVLLEDIVFLKHIFLFLSEPELLQSAFLVCTKWADAATQAHAELMLMSVGCNNVIPLESDGNRSCLHKDTHVLLDKPWDYLTLTYPWARFLSEGGFKQVYKVFNRKFRALEAISVM